MSDESALFLSQVPNQVLTTIILLAALALVWRMYKIERDTSDPFAECGCVHLQGNSQFDPCPMEMPLESVSHVGQWIQALQQRHWVCTTRCKHRAGCYVIEEIVEFSAPAGCEDWELDHGWYVSPDGTKRAIAEKSKSFANVAHGSRNNGRFFSRAKISKKPQSRGYLSDQAAAEEATCTI